MIRAIYRTDVLAFFFSSPHERPNEAISREVPGKSNFFSPEIFLEHWLPWKGRRRTWVTDEDGSINSLISVKSNKASKIWYVDYLQASDERNCFALLEYVSAAAAKRGVHKMFINLSVNSPMMDVARHAGFSSFNTYYIYKYGGISVPKSVPIPDQYSIRTMLKGDEISLYNLYHASAPLTVRSAEGLTLEEWQDRMGCCSWFIHRTEYLIYRNGNLEGYLRVSFAGRIGCFEIIFRHIEGVGLEWLVNQGLSCLGGKTQIFGIVSVDQWQLRGMLENSQFEQIAKFETMVKENTIRVEEPQYMPLRA